MDALSAFLVDFLAEKLDVPAESLATSQPFEEMELDSLVLVELAVILEEKFGVVVGDDELTAEQTLDDVLALLASKGVAV